MKRMEVNFLTNVHLIAFNIDALYHSKNLIDKIKYFIISRTAMRKVRRIKNTKSPYYEWYYNILDFLNLINYDSDMIKNVAISNAGSYNIAKCDIIYNNIDVDMEIKIPLERSGIPCMNIVISLPNGSIMRRYYVSDLNVSPDHDPTHTVMYINKALHIMNDEVVKACEDLLYKRI